MHSYIKYIAVQLMLVLFSLPSHAAFTIWCDNKGVPEFPVPVEVSSSSFWGLSIKIDTPLLTNDCKDALEAQLKPIFKQKVEQGLIRNGRKTYFKADIIIRQP